MHVELSVALNFLMSHLYNKLPRRRVDVFAEELEKGLKIKFGEHWYPEEPFKGSGFRSIRIMEGKIDPVLRLSSQCSGLSLEEIMEQLPKGLTIWVDPGEVSYRVGETGQVTILYYNRKNPEQVEVPTPMPYPEHPQSYVGSPNEVSSNAEQLSQLLNSFGERNEAISSLNNLMTTNQFEQELASSLERLKFESNPTLPYASINNYMQTPQPNSNYLLGLSRPGTNQNCFTAAAFAQTKFGSTKMKTHTTPQTRPNKLFNSTDLQSRLSLAAQLNAVSARSPGSFMPFPGLQYDQWNGNQASAPSSSLNSPSNPPMNNQVLQNLIPSQMSSQAPNSSLNMPQTQQMFDCFANSMMSNNVNKPTFGNTPQIKTKEATPPSLSPSFFPINNARKPFNPVHQQQQQQQQQPNYPFNSLSPKQPSEGSNSSLDPFSSSSSTSFSDNSPPTNVDSIEWNNPLTPYPNIQQLLLAN